MSEAGWARGREHARDHYFDFAESVPWRMSSVPGYSLCGTVKLAKLTPAKLKATSIRPCMKCDGIRQRREEDTEYVASMSAFAGADRDARRSVEHGAVFENPAFAERLVGKEKLVGKPPARKRRTISEAVAADLTALTAGLGYSNALLTDALEFVRELAKTWKAEGLSGDAPFYAKRANAIFKKHGVDL